MTGAPNPSLHQVTMRLKCVHDADADWAGGFVEGVAHREESWEGDKRLWGCFSLTLETVPHHLLSDAL
jgi:hypothetical protein